MIQKSVLEIKSPQTSISSIPTENREFVLLDIIEKNPGIQFREIMRLSGLKNGVLSYYLSKKEKNGSIQLIRTARVTIIYPIEIPEKHKKIITRLRQSTPQKIILNLLNQELSFRSLVQKVQKSPSTTSFYLKKLKDDQIVLCSFRNRVKICKINPEIFKEIKFLQEKLQLNNFCTVL